MTTIVYRNGVMASDSALTDGHEDGPAHYIGDCQKVFRLASGAVYGSSGDDDDRDLRALLDHVRNGSEMPSREQLYELTAQDMNAIVAFAPDDVWLIHVSDKDASACQIASEYLAIGAGKQFAMGALAAGVNAVQAVQLAIQHDINSRGPVQVIRLEEPKPSTEPEQSFAIN